MPSALADHAFLVEPLSIAEKALDLTDPAYFGKARELYLELRQHRLDSGANSTGKPLKFPTLPQPTLSKTPSLDQLVASPVDSANFAPAASATIRSAYHSSHRDL